MRRIFEFWGAAILFVTLFVPMLCIAMWIKLTSRGPVLHASKRIGKNNEFFRMLKFRTMYVETPQLATHLLPDPSRWITPFGRILRKTSLDELPQLWCILTGDMSFVGPRPALFNQHDLISLRTSRGIDRLLPGLTGWAQVNGRDSLSIPEKVALDEYYLNNQSARLNAWILLQTFLQVIRANDVAETGPTTTAHLDRRAS
jgi:O-antigen biosynthesis protein WbqP